MKHTVLITFSVLIFAIVVVILVLVSILKIDANKLNPNHHKKKHNKTHQDVTKLMNDLKSGKIPFIVASKDNKTDYTVISPNSAKSVEVVPSKDFDQLTTSQYADLHLILGTSATGGYQLRPASGNGVLGLNNGVLSFQATNPITLTVQKKGKQLGFGLPNSKYLDVNATTGLTQSKSFKALDFIMTS